MDISHNEQQIITLAEQGLGADAIAFELDAKPASVREKLSRLMAGMIASGPDDDEQNWNVNDSAAPAIRRCGTPVRMTGTGDATTAMLLRLGIYVDPAEPDGAHVEMVA